MRSSDCFSPSLAATTSARSVRTSDCSREIWPSSRFWSSRDERCSSSGMRRSSSRSTAFSAAIRSARCSALPPGRCSPPPPLLAAVTAGSRRHRKSGSGPVRTCGATSPLPLSASRWLIDAPELERHICSAPIGAPAGAPAVAVKDCCERLRADGPGLCGRLLYTALTAEPAAIGPCG